MPEPDDGARFTRTSGQTANQETVVMWYVLSGPFLIIGVALNLIGDMFGAIGAFIRGDDAPDESEAELMADLDQRE